MEIIFQYDFFKTEVGQLIVKYPEWKGLNMAGFFPPQETFIEIEDTKIYETVKKTVRRHLQYALKYCCTILNNDINVYYFNVQQFMIAKNIKETVFNEMPQIVEFNEFIYAVKTFFLQPSAEISHELPKDARNEFDQLHKAISETIKSILKTKTSHQKMAEMVIS